MNQEDIKIRINEIFYSIQGEGFWAGSPAVFVRFSGCNRKCYFCDTEHESYQEMTIGEIVDAVSKFSPCKHVIITGGEPLIQEKGFYALCDALVKGGYIIHVETNGDFLVDKSRVHWITVSPKGPEWKQRTGMELKVVFINQKKEELDAYLFSDANSSGFLHYYLQPCSTPEGSNIADVVEYIKKDPCWTLSVQLHKLIGVR